MVLIHKAPILMGIRVSIKLPDFNPADDKGMMGFILRPLREA